ncbi:MAG TPA: radical SAM protein [Anaerolineae bacterium]|nr:radical SAM protein [Anaerolineae bacterium]
MIQPVGRNDPCPCGSGKKYKQCHGRLAPPGLQPPAQVLYVHPAKQDVDFYAQHLDSHTGALGRPYGLMPLGLPALVNLLRQNGIEVRGLNYPMEKKLAPAFDLRRWLKAQRSRARLILIDMHWYEHTYGAISVAQVCKEVLPEAWTVLGGLTASGFARDILVDFAAVDFVIRGDAEMPLLKLAQRLLADPQRSDAILDFGDIPNLSYRQDGGVVETPQTYCAAAADLDRLNFADIDFLEHHEEYFIHEYIVTDLQVARQTVDKSAFRGRWLCTARGCKFECSYCGGCQSAHKMLAGRDGIVPRSPEKVVEELGRLAENQVIQASMSYDIAELGEAYWRKLFSLLRKSGVRIGLYNEFFQLPPAGLIKDFARSVDMTHSCLALSPLSGNERVRRLNGKRYTNRELLDLLDALNLHNVSIFVYFSLNLPGENETTLEETIALARQICDVYPTSLLKILNSCHTVDPLSPMQQHPEKYDITVSMTTFRDFYNYCRETQLAAPEARTGAWRGFTATTVEGCSLKVMADKWDAARQGHESCWWPIPPSW